MEVQKVCLKNRANQHIELRSNAGLPVGYLNVGDLFKVEKIDIGRGMVSAVLKCVLNSHSQKRTTRLYWVYYKDSNGKSRRAEIMASTAPKARLALSQKVFDYKYITRTTDAGRKYLTKRNVRRKDP